MALLKGNTAAGNGGAVYVSGSPGRGLAMDRVRPPTTAPAAPGAPSRHGGGDALLDRRRQSVRGRRRRNRLQRHRVRRRHLRSTVSGNRAASSGGGIHQPSLRRLEPPREWWDLRCGLDNRQQPCRRRRRRIGHPAEFNHRARRGHRRPQRCGAGAPRRRPLPGQRRRDQGPEHDRGAQRRRRRRDRPRLLRRLERLRLAGLQPDRQRRRMLGLRRRQRPVRRAAGAGQAADNGGAKTGRRPPLADDRAWAWPRAIDQGAQHQRFDDQNVDQVGRSRTSAPTSGSWRETS